MGKHKEIEKILLCELLEEEKRASRTLRVIQHQEQQIETLNKKLTESMDIVNSYQNEKMTLKSDKGVQCDAGQDSATILIKHLKPIDTCTCKREVVQRSKRTIRNKGLHCFQVNSDYKSEIRNEFLEFEKRISQLQSELEETREKSNLHNRKIYKLQLKVSYLKKASDDTGIFLKQLNGWKSKIEGVITNFGTDETIEMGEIETRVWKTARKFFSTDEAHLFLSKPEMNL